jgi:glutathionyl-hydroquinone reductase
VTDLGSVSTPWILTRASDANKGSEFAPNKVVWVRPGGDEFGDTNYKQSTGTDVVLGTTIIEFMATYSGSFDEEIVEITGADVPFEVSVTHSLNTKFVTGNAVDADFNEARFVYVATDSSHVKVLSGAIIPAGVKFQIMLRGRVVV